MRPATDVQKDARKAGRRARVWASSVPEEEEDTHKVRSGRHPTTQSGRAWLGHRASDGCFRCAAQAELCGLLPARPSPVEASGRTGGATEDEEEVEFLRGSNLACAWRGTGPCIRRIAPHFSGQIGRAHV